MEFGFAFRSLIFYLLVMMCASDVGARMHHSKQHIIDKHLFIDGKYKHDDDDHRASFHERHVHDHTSSHMNPVDPSTQIFFNFKDLQVGNKIPVYFPNKDPSASPHFLTREKADSIPFSSAQLSYLLDLFSFPQGSPQAKAVEDTLRHCERQPLEGETKFCATSLESMLDSARKILGLESQLKVLTTTHLTKSSKTKLAQDYSILEDPKEIRAPKIIGCHPVPYPYAVFYCHCQESDNKLFEVSLGGENGDRLKASAICHMDTSQWDGDHVAFRLLQIEPGTSPVCHFFPEDNLVWV
ncbi:BURP domain [Dillenia turbinata]|uniref:BURP domain n=1 Tax=Dillenia turbinata TaxID=194707 RepID=A0AAN8WDA9_9MAGN